MIHHLQCGNKGVVFQSAAEDAELYRIVILQIYARIPSAAIALLGMV